MAADVARVNGSKLASSVADRIVADIAARGWPEGEVVGSEPELLERYGVSRAVFREAVRLVEHQQVARMRRGPGGGLVVTAPTVASVTDAVTVYLFFVRAHIDEVFEARLALEETVAELAPARLTEADIEALRDFVRREQAGKAEDHRELHALLATITKNPALGLFVDLLNRASFLYLSDASSIEGATKSASHRAHAAIVEAVLAGNEGLASHRMRKHLQAEADYLRRRRSSRRQLDVVPPEAVEGGKRGEVLARRILAEVTAAGWPVGELLGAEAELMERHGVSRAVLREAVRVLEHHQVARMRRGPGGGLFVTEPGVEATTGAIAIHLDRLGIEPDHLFEVRTAVEMAVLDRVVARLDDDGVTTLEQALASEKAASTEAFPRVGHDLHAVLAGLSGNRVLELLVLVLIRLTRIHAAAPAGASVPQGNQDVMRVHGRIVEAIVDRDLELARHRMRVHFDWLRDWVR